MYSAKSRSADRRRQRGISLVEAMMTAAMLSIGFLGLTASTLIVTKTSKSADSRGAAVSLATERLELLRSMPLDAAGHTPGSYNGGSFSPNGSSGGPITITWTVSAKDTPRPGLKTVTVTSAWHDTIDHTVQVGAYVRCSMVPCRI
jgi:Tfp pilus assembly protein PilV